MNLSRVWIVFLICGLCPLQAQEDNLTQIQAEARSALVADVTYILSLSFKSGAESYQGEVTIQFDLTDPSQPLMVDFNGEITSIHLNDASVTDYDYKPSRGNLIIPAGRAVAGANRLSIAFNSTFSRLGFGFHRYVDPLDGREYLYTDLQPNYAHHVFPCFDQPDLRARFIVDVLVPRHWVAAGNGHKVQAQFRGDHQWVRFEPMPPIATYLFNLVIGEYAEWHDYSGSVPMSIYCRQSKARYADPESFFSISRQAMAFFQDYYQVPFPFSKYDHAFVPEYNAGAMENAGIITVNEFLIFDEEPNPNRLILRDQVIIHELAHQWFGDLVTMKWWNDLWLNESFASYMEIVGLKGIRSAPVWPLAAQAKLQAYRADQLVTTHPIVGSIPDVYAAGNSFDAITYNKGSAALQQLDFYLGKTFFRDGIRSYLKKHAWSNTTLADFVTAMEQAADRELDDWVDQWLNSSGFNDVEIRWQARNGRIITASVHQGEGTGDKVLRQHAMMIGLFYADENGLAEARDRLRIEFHGAETSIPELAGRPVPLFIQPNLEAHDYARIKYDPISLKWLLKNRHKIKDPDYRDMTWTHLWDMVEEGSLGAFRFFDLAYKDIKSADLSFETLRSQGFRLKRLARNYVPQSKGISLQTKLFNLAKSKLSEELPSAAHQNFWFELLIDMAREPKQLDYLERLYLGNSTLKQLAIEEEEQWRLLEGLIESDHPKARAYFEQRIGDASQDRIEELALYLRSLFADPKTKEETWNRMLTDQDLSLDQKRAMIRGFFSDKQIELAKAFIDRYFAAIEEIYRKSDFIFAENLIRGLYPTQGGAATLAAAEAFLAREDLPKTLRDIVLGETDQLRKYLTIAQSNDGKGS